LPEFTDITQVLKRTYGLFQVYVNPKHGEQGTILHLADAKDKESIYRSRVPNGTRAN
jgi:hypothetical protein